MKHHNLNALLDLALIATSGGLGKASRASGRSKTTLSRRIAELEEHLCVRLIERGARGLRLTEIGERLVARTEGPMQEVIAAMNAARDGPSTPRGHLRVASPVLFAQLALGPICTDFCAAYPEVSVEVVAEDRLVDMVEEKFDAAIRINPGPDNNMVGRCFAKDRLVVVAAPAIPIPIPGAIRPVSAIIYSNFRSAQWTLNDGLLVLDPIPRLRLPSFLSIRDAAVAGAGVALIPQSIAWEQLTSGELVQWGIMDGMDVSLWVLHTSRRLVAPKVQAFVQFICSRHTDEFLVLKG